MDKVKYETEAEGDLEFSVTMCERLKRRYIYIGSAFCMGCSYCYAVNREEQYVKCRKKVK